MWGLKKLSIRLAWNIVPYFRIALWSQRLLTSEPQGRLLNRHFGSQLGLLRGNALRGQRSFTIGRSRPPIGQNPPILLAAGHVTLTKTKMGREVSYFERWNV